MYEKITAAPFNILSCVCPLVSVPKYNIYNKNLKQYNITVILTYSGLLLGIVSRGAAGVFVFSGISVVLFDTLGISMEAQYVVSVESSSLTHHRSCP